MKLQGKTAVVTGAAKGIGAAIAKRLYDDGADTIIVLDLKAEEAISSAKAIDPSGTRVFGYECNVADRENVKAVFSDILAKFNKVDILVNNAGITRDGMFHKMTEDQWDLVIDVNLKGVYNCCREVIDKMREQKYGKIVNISSVSAFGNIGQTNYGASKAGVIGFTKCLAREAARNNCTVNAIAPSYIDTDMLQAVPEAVMQKFIDSIPMNRLGSKEELAAVASFLCSDDSSFVTGECIVVSGGSYM